MRLAQEIFERCLHHLGESDGLCVYDPCCGSGYLLTVLGFLNIGRIRKLIGSDIDDAAISIAERNLSLLSEDGMKARLDQLNCLYEQYRKDSHKDAIISAQKMITLLGSNDSAVETLAFRHDILSGNAADKRFQADIAITDVPYGNLVSWQGSGDDAISMLLNNLACFLRPGSIVAICSDKKQRFSHCRFKRLEKQIVGKRRFEILRFTDD